jgi:hypothetical protein
MLEQSVAPTDTSLRRLLLDLDLVLIQIAQYAASPEAHAIERSLIEDALMSRSQSWATDTRSRWLRRMRGIGAPTRSTARAWMRATRCS